MTQQPAIPELRRPMEAGSNVAEMGDSILAVIARASTDPKVDVDKLERLLAMQERVLAREAEQAFNAALAELQLELPEIEERGEIKIGNKVQSTYALWEDTNATIKPILKARGFVLTFRTCRRDGETLVIGTLKHIAGHREESELPLKADTSGSKNDVQAVGSGVSYAKRYIADALLNLTSRGQDDDGQRAGMGGFIDDHQLAMLQNLASAGGADLERFCKYFKIDALPHLPAAKFEQAVTLLQKKIRA